MINEIVELVITNEDNEKIYQLSISKKITIKG